MLYNAMEEEPVRMGIEMESAIERNDENRRRRRRAMWT